MILRFGVEKLGVDEVQDWQWLEQGFGGVELVTSLLQYVEGLKK
jgi:hypothetical protein